MNFHESNLEKVYVLNGDFEGKTLVVVHVQVDCGTFGAVQPQLDCLTLLRGCGGCGPKIELCRRETLDKKNWD